MKLTCNHPSSAVCSGCMPETSSDTKTLLKCSHNTTTFCPNCLPKTTSKFRISPESASLRCVCQSNTNSKCIVCIRAQELLINTIPFKKHLQNLSRGCIAKNHKDSENCKLCLYTIPKPIPSSVLSGDITKCNHKPYPQGSCTNCLPKPFHMNSQTFRRVDYIVFEDKRVIERLVGIWQRDLTQTFSVYLYGVFEPEPETTNNSLSMRATIKAVSNKMYLSSNKVLKALNLQLIGEAKSVLPSKENRIMHPDDILKACKVSKGMEYPFTLVYLKFDKNNIIDTTALSVSDQCLTLYNVGVLSKCNDSIVLKKPCDNLEEYLPVDIETKERLKILKQLPLVLYRGKEIRYFEGGKDFKESKINEELFIVKSVISSATEQRYMFKHIKFGWSGSNECIKTFVEININDRNLLSDFNFFMEIGEFLDVGTLLNITDRIKRNMDLNVEFNYNLVSMFC